MAKHHNSFIRKELYNLSVSEFVFNLRSLDRLTQYHRYFSGLIFVIPLLETNYRKYETKSL